MSQMSWLIFSYVLGHASNVLLLIKAAIYSARSSGIFLEASDMH
jgi:hypothetical protein